jgi:hypothetical protein
VAFLRRVVLDKVAVLGRYLPPRSAFSPVF